MLGWLRRLVWGDPDAERLVFRFRDGSRKRWADPIAVERGLIEALGRDWRQVLVDLAKPVPQGLVGEQRIEAESRVEDLRARVLRATHAAFGTTPLTDVDGRPSGLTEVEAFDLLGGFLRFCDDLVRLARPFQRPQPRASPGDGDPPPASTSAST